MSGICGILRLDGNPVAREDLLAVASPLKWRGPDGTALHLEGPAGFGHALLDVAPLGEHEAQPLHDPQGGCLITADARLDNRADLIEDLWPGVERQGPPISDARIILAAYLRWGRGSISRLLGDFAFAIWDPRQQRLFAARDRFGVKPLLYHHNPRFGFVFGSSVPSVLEAPFVERRMNRARIADFLDPALEGHDKVSTFYEAVFRLPPAHHLTLERGTLKIERYWVLERGPTLRLKSDADYASAFLEVFEQAVQARLRSGSPVGVTLSGGMDSGSCAAVAARLLAHEGRGPLKTFSAIGPDPGACVETRAILAASRMPGLEPHMISHDALASLLPDLARLTWTTDEPFDGHMTMLRAAYLLAHRQGVKVVLDGGSGDEILDSGNYIARLLRDGQWRRAWAEAQAGRNFWGKEQKPLSEFLGEMRVAFMPQWARRVRHVLLRRSDVRRRLRQLKLNPAFAAEIAFDERLETLRGYHAPGVALDQQASYIESLDHPFMAVGQERYDRVAASLGIERRDPFLDSRVVELCLRLPDDQFISNGWPKIILRRAMNGLLPDEVRWRAGKEHLGFAFTKALMRLQTQAAAPLVAELRDYVLPDHPGLGEGPPEAQDDDQLEATFDLLQLATWLRRQSGNQ